MWKKLASMIAGSILVSSCQTAMYKPIICQPGTALKEGRCQKVGAPLVDAPKVRTKKPRIEGPGISAPLPVKPKMNVYGQPI